MKQFNIGDILGQRLPKMPRKMKKAYKKIGYGLVGRITYIQKGLGFHTITIMPER